MNYYPETGRAGRAPLLAAVGPTSIYRGPILAAVLFCLAIAGAGWALQHTGPVQRVLYGIPPGATYHVQATGQVVPGDAAKPPPARPAATPPHANLLDHAYHITAEFGHYPNGGAHYGIDVDAWTGTLTHAPVGGTVTEVLRGCVAGDVACGQGWGNHVWFKSAETGDYILVAHFEQLADWVLVGATFDAGAPFGLSGSTGFSSGPHVHIQANPTQMGNAGSTNPAWEFPWLHCGEPVLGALFGAACQ